MAKDKDSELSLKVGFKKALPRTITQSEKNEGTARLYSTRGRLALSGNLLSHLKIQHEYYELFFDKDRKIVAIKFGNKSPDSFKATEAKGGARFVELRGPFKRQSLEIPKQDGPIVVRILKNTKEDFLYFSYADFAKEIPPKKTAK